MFALIHIYMQLPLLNVKQQTDVHVEQVIETNKNNILCSWIGIFFPNFHARKKLVTNTFWY